MRPNIKPWNGSRLTYAQVYRDGYWFTVSKNSYGECSIINKIGDDWYERLKSVPDIQAGLTSMKNNVSIGGVLYLPDETPSRIIKAIQGNLKALRFEAIYTTDMQRNAELADVQDYCNAAGFKFPAFYSGGGLRGSMGEFRAVNQLDVAPSHNGFMLKNGNMLNWQLYRPRLNGYLHIVEIREGKGQNLGSAGSIVCEDGDGNRATIIQYPEPLRGNISADPSKYIGRLVMISYVQRCKNGGYKYPKLIALSRPDLTWGENIYWRD